MNEIDDFIDPIAKIYLVMGVHPAGRIATRMVLAASAAAAIKAANARLPGETARWSTIAAVAWETLEAEHEIFVSRIKEGIAEN